MGWMVVFVIQPFARLISPHGLVLLSAGCSPVLRTGVSTEERSPGLRVAAHDGAS
jgi:hypothetical protein